MYVHIRRAPTAMAVAALCVAVASGAADANTARSAHHAAAATVAVRAVPVLGSRHFWPGPNDRGFGHAHPRRIFNGGDPSGLVRHIRWTHWGARRSHGWGRTFIFKPHGGYYRRAVRAELRAGNLGHCTAHSRLAYRHLEVREPRRPGGRLGKWFSWSGRTSLC